MPKETENARIRFERNRTIAPSSRGTSQRSNPAAESAIGLGSLFVGIRRMEQTAHATAPGRQASSPADRPILMTRVECKPVGVADQCPNAPIKRGRVSESAAFADTPLGHELPVRGVGQAPPLRSLVWATSARGPHRPPSGRGDRGGGLRGRTRTCCPLGGPWRVTSSARGHCTAVGGVPWPC